MGAITAAVIAIAGVVLGWITIEIACKPCLEKGRQAIDHSLDPDYDPDDAIVADNVSSTLRAPLNPNPTPDLHHLNNIDPKAALVSSSTSHDVIKAV